MTFQLLFRYNNRMLKVFTTATTSITQLTHHCVCLTVGAVISNFSLRFKIKQTELCFRQRVIADDGSISSFNLTLVPDRLVRIGTNGTAHMFMSEYSVMFE